jgi:TrpR family trp operon transcriptional repressor
MKPRSRNEKSAKSQKEELNKLIALLKDAAEVEELFKELLTPAEYEDLARRWHLVRLLITGASQREVSKEVGIGVATVTRGARELRNESCMFKHMYERLYSK